VRVAFLVRHAAHDLLGTTLAGRSPGVRLNDAGRAQAERLAARLAREEPCAILSSPLERCLETAAPLGRLRHLAVEPVEALQEIDFGAWSGRSFEALRGDPAWVAWNARRGSARCPGGESMLEAQARIARRLERLPPGRTVLVSHGDVIKAALCWALGLPLDLLHRFEISPGSVSALELGEAGPRALWLNEPC
jgi:broad specificity phosphatase PhoE